MYNTIIISAASLERLNRNSRLFSYVMTSFTKTYCRINQDSLILYFKGPKSLMSFRLQLESICPTSVCFSIDINKLLSAVRKMSVQNQTLKLTLSDNPANVTIYSNTTNDKITFSANFYDENSVEITSLTSFFVEKEPLFSTKITTLQISPALLDFAFITNSYMSTINKNNAILIDKEKLVYSDRIIVVKRYIEALTSTVLDEVKIHRFILGFMDFVINDSPELKISQDGNFVYWQSSIDSDFKAILVIDPCIISTPEDEDIASIIPENSEEQIIECSPTDLIESIDFFTGLFEASIWKPITFTWSKENGGDKVRLTYKHPSTEIQKDLTNYSITGNLGETNASFTLISDSLKVLLGKADTDGKVYIHFNNKSTDEAHGAGVLVSCKDSNNVTIYDAVLAKLAEN